MRVNIASGQIFSTQAISQSCENVNMLIYPMWNITWKQWDCSQAVVFLCAAYTFLALFFFCFCKRVLWLVLLRPVPYNRCAKWEPQFIIVIFEDSKCYISEVIHSWSMSELGDGSSFLWVPLFIEHYFWCVDVVVKSDGMSSKTRLEWQNKEVGSWLNSLSSFAQSLS